MSNRAETQPGVSFGAAPGGVMSERATAIGCRLQRRLSEPQDEEFLRRLCAESRPEFDALPEPARTQIVQMQLSAQRRQYRDHAPDSVEQIVELDHTPIGRCWISTRPDAHRLLDLSITGVWRNHGHGTRLLRELQADAARAHVPLGLAVWAANAGARRLYERLGFEQVREANGYLEMQWMPQIR